MGRLRDLLHRSRRVTEELPTARLEQPPAAPPLLAGNVQGIGRRERQEDSFALLNAADMTAFREKGLFAVVADGMGGLADGREASEAAVSGFLQLFAGLAEDGALPRQLVEGTLAVNEALFRRFGGRSGTTAVAVRVHQGQLHWVSVGDSAIFLMRSGGVFQVNREHTRLNELYLQELGREPSDRTRAEADEDARRLSSFLGMGTVPEVDYNRRPFLLRPGDVLSGCSDGSSGVVPPWPPGTYRPTRSTGSTRWPRMLPSGRVWNQDFSSCSLWKVRMLWAASLICSRCSGEMDAAATAMSCSLTRWSRVMTS